MSIVEVDAPPAANPLVFPADDCGPDTTSLVLSTAGEFLPAIAWVGPRAELGVTADASAAVVAAAGEAVVPLLPEHWRGLITRPGLRGFRLQPDEATTGGAAPDAGRGRWSGGAWSTRFRTTAIDCDAATLTVEAEDPVAGLTLRTEIQSAAGGGLRIRHILTNTDSAPYVVDGLEVVVPVPDSHTEVLDFSGRHERERFPQRHTITDGLWLREGRQGRTGLDAATMMITGPSGFGFSDGSLLGLHVAWSGNVTLRIERDGATGTTLGGGEMLLPGELALGLDESYTTPWVHVVASAAGLDGVAAAFHQWLRSRPHHPDPAPVTLNVWEAVYFNHDLGLLKELANRAAAIGVERFVLDDGWFHLRRDDTAGLGDWWIDPAVWSEGLAPIIEHVRALGMGFGLWFEPEMVNRDSDLYRAHPEWVLATGDREPLLHRHQLVLDLTRPEVWQYLFDQIDALLSENDISYVKWDHNRDLLEAGSGTTGGAPAVHEQTLAFYRLLDVLRARHPDVSWESCASGGGRIDLGVLERAERVWTSDMTEALARQSIQRWTAQLVAPEFLGAHVSAPSSHQTGRTLPLDFRAATALFGSFGIEWDLTQAGPDDITKLAEWIRLYKQFRTILHSGRMVRIESADPAVLMHGVVSLDRREALLAHVQMDESSHNRGLKMRIPGLDQDRSYRASWLGPVDRHVISVASQVDSVGPGGGVPLPGVVLANQGLWIPRRRPETILLVHLVADE